MNYLNVEENKEHIKTLIKWLFNESLSAGGDGDALWYSRFYDIKDIKLLADEINKEVYNNFYTSGIEDKTLIYENNQESIIITNNKEEFNSSPDWIQAKIIY